MKNCFFKKISSKLKDRVIELHRRKCNNSTRSLVSYSKYKQLDIGFRGTFHTRKDPLGARVLFFTYKIYAFVDITFLKTD